MTLKKGIYITLLLFLILITGCSMKTTEEKVNQHLDQAASFESGIEAEQNEMMELERIEQSIYSQMLELKPDEEELAESLFKKATRAIDTREAKLDDERDSINESQEEFNQLRELVKYIDDEEAKPIAEQMIKVMDRRYEAHDNLYKTYKHSLELERELYQMLEQEEQPQAEIKEQIKTINKSYQNILDYNEQFNKHTSTYNGLKNKFQKLEGQNHI